MKALKVFIKPFKAPQRGVKKKFKLIFILIQFFVRGMQWTETGRAGLIVPINPFQVSVQFLFVLENIKPLVSRCFQGI